MAHKFVSFARDEQPSRAEPTGPKSESMAFKRFAGQPNENSLRADRHLQSLRGTQTRPETRDGTQVQPPARDFRSASQSRAPQWRRRPTPSHARGGRTGTGSRVLRRLSRAMNPLGTALRMGRRRRRRGLDEERSSTKEPFARDFVSQAHAPEVAGARHHSNRRWLCVQIGSGCTSATHGRHWPKQRAALISRVAEMMRPARALPNAVRTL